MYIVKYSRIKALRVKTTCVHGKSHNYDLVEKKMYGRSSIF
jgi:hypothetical protein